MSKSTKFLFQISKHAAPLKIEMGVVVRRVKSEGKERTLVLVIRTRHCAFTKLLKIEFVSAKMSTQQTTKESD